MRPTRVVSATALAVSLAALAPAGASAAAHSNARSRCDINIHVAPRLITAGDPVVIFGRLACPRHTGQTVRLFHHVRGVPGVRPVGVTRTDARGLYEFSRADGKVQSNRYWFVRSRGARSARAYIRVAAQVTLSGPAQGTQLLTGPKNAVTFTGTVNPADVGARIILQRQNAATGNDDWRRIDAGRVTATGRFSITHTFVVPGDASIRVLVRSRGRNIPSPSNLLEYEISQAQNPALTIVSSQDPISFGQSVTISGTLAQGPLQPVTLLARTAAQPAFTPVAAAVTDAQGRYSFPAQSPANNTQYVVRSAMRSSAVLFEGVHDLLTAQASSTSVQAGQPVTFSGTVAPDHTGHVIYLERRNADSGEFHVVQVASVGSGSLYSITHRIYDPGNDVFRVFIPGGPENEGAASQTFTIQVSRNRPEALSPEASGNSSQPAAGQQ